MGLHVIVMMGITMICSLVQPALSSARNAHQTRPLLVLNALLEHISTPVLLLIANASQPPSIIHRALALHIAVILYANLALMHQWLIPLAQPATPLLG